MYHIKEAATVVIGRLKGRKCTILFKLLKEKIADGEETVGASFCS